MDLHHALGRDPDSSHRGWHLPCIGWQPSPRRAFEGPFETLCAPRRTTSQRKQKLVLFGARELVAEVLDAAALDTLIAIVPSEADARAIIAG